MILAIEDGDQEVESSLEDLLAANECISEEETAELKALQIGESVLLGFERVTRVK